MSREAYEKAMAQLPPRNFILMGPRTETAPGIYEQQVFAGTFRDLPIEEAREWLLRDLGLDGR